MDALFNHRPALMHAHVNWKRAFSRENLKVRQSWCSNSGLISTAIN